MKMRWVFVGAIAAVVGSFLVVKHFSDHKNTPQFVENESEKKFGEFPPEIPESEFDEVDFLS